MLWLLILLPHPGATIKPGSHQPISIRDVIGTFTMTWKHPLRYVHVDAVTTGMVKKELKHTQFF